MYYLKNCEVTKMQYQIPRIGRLLDRQHGLERQMSGAKVFDRRDDGLLPEYRSVFLGNEKTGPYLYFMVTSGQTISNMPKLPFVKTQIPIVVTGLIPEGYFGYSCCGAHESDPQYVALSTNEDGLLDAIDRLHKINGKEIIYGRELDAGLFANYIHKREERRKNRVVARQVDAFYKLPPSAQKSRLETLMAKAVSFDFL